VTESFGDLLALIDSDPQPRNQDQSAVIKAAILRDGRDHGGNVNPNRVREGLRDVTLFHRRIGAAYYALKAAGLIERGELITSDDRRGRNSGRPIWSYRLTEAGWLA
jgi:hypothetical protein